MDVPGAPPNTAFNALAGLTLLQDPSTAPLAQPVIGRLVQTKGLRSGQRSGPAGQQHSSVAMGRWDGELGGAHGLVPAPAEEGSIAIAQPGSGRTDRSRRAVLFDRVCHEGGWNYGNPEVYGQKLWPYVPTTAVALLAMQDHRNHSVVHTEPGAVAERCGQRAFGCRRCAHHHLPSRVWCRDRCARTGRRRAVGSG